MVLKEDHYFKCKLLFQIFSQPQRKCLKATHTSSGERRIHICRYFTQIHLICITDKLGERQIQDTDYLFLPYQAATVLFCFPTLRARKRMYIKLGKFYCQKMMFICLDKINNRCNRHMATTSPVEIGLLTYRGGMDHSRLQTQKGDSKASFCM